MSNQPNTDPYAAIARFYDLEYDDYTEDLEFYVNLARNSSGPILDAATGTGRVALALAMAGHMVVGVDSSPAMLAVARSKATGPLAKRAQFVNADLRSLQLKQRFSLVIVAANSFCHLLTEEDQSQALDGLRSHLTDDGQLVIALQNPYVWALDSNPDQVLLEWEKDGPGEHEKTRKTNSGSSDLATQVRSINLWYDVAGSDAALRRHSAALQLRWFYRYELELLLQRHRFHPRSWYGSYDLEPYSDGSPLLLVVATAA